MGQKFAAHESSYEKSSEELEGIVIWPPSDNSKHFEVWVTYSTLSPSNECYFCMQIWLFTLMKEPPVFQYSVARTRQLKSCGVALIFCIEMTTGVFLDSSAACWQWKQHPHVNFLLPTSGGCYGGRGGRLTFYSVAESITQIAAPLPYESPFCCLLQITLRSWQWWVMPRKGIKLPYTFLSNCTVRKQAKLPSLRADSQISFKISYPLLSLLEDFTML